jgi:hypothetical protein
VHICLFYSPEGSLPPLFGFFLKVSPAAIVVLFCIACSNNNSNSPTNTPSASGINKINHIIVIYLENHSFDNLYGEFPGANGPLQALNVMKLFSPESAILSAVIFNAIIIILLIPLALRGVKYKPSGAGAILRQNLFIYGLGGVVAPFIGVKLIDMIIVALEWV